MFRTSRRDGFRVLASVVAAFVLAGTAAARDQTVIVSDDFASCVMDLQCPPLPDCEASSFNLDGFCSADCFPGGGPPVCGGFADAGASGDSWTASGLFAAFVSPGGDTPDVQITFQVIGSLPTPEELELSVSVGLFGGYVPFQSGQVEVSVFRFSGDPTVFDGLDVPSVFVLVTLGLIDADDVLFSQEIEVPDEEDDLDFDFAVDVTGVPSEEIVVFASHSGSAVPVPALSAWGYALLALGSLLASAWMLTRPR